jgi:hypothetical protein
MEAAQHEAVAGDVGHGQGKALVAAGVLERVVPDQADPLDRPPTGCLEDGGTGRQLVELAADGEDLVEVGLEDGAEILAVGPADQSVEPPSEAPDLALLDESQEEQAEDRQA